MVILVTGANGFIGKCLTDALLEAGYEVAGLDLKERKLESAKYRHYSADLSDKDAVARIMKESRAERIIHLAALAHTVNEKDLSWDRYYHVNVECSRNVFSAAGSRPVLYISTIDVFGFYDGKKPVNGLTPVHPVSKYGKSKAMAEEECKKLEHYSIFRLSPVYTDSLRRDIQKRYYLKYPHIAYQVGSGTAFEILNLSLAVENMVRWCSSEPKNDIRIIKDSDLMWTPDYIKAEKAAGRANIVLRFPRWMVNLGYSALKGILGENEKTYLLNKAVHPLRSE